jgi:GNAT superfamily N-acetyltransferase
MTPADAPGSSVSIELVSPAKADDADAVDALVALVNRAYSTAERGLWDRDLPRTTADEVTSRITAGGLVAARLDGDDGRVGLGDGGTAFVGAVFTSLIDPRTGWFGALSVTPECAGRGLGRQLVEYVEHRARVAGAATMQLELLVPADPHPHTSRLARWYAALGYRQVDELDLADLDPGSVIHAFSPIRVAVMQRPL